MGTTYRSTVAVTVAMFLAACSPGLYTGGGWADTVSDGTNEASFSFSVERCNDEALGHFSLSDEGWRIPVEISGHVVNFSEQGEFGGQCGFYGLLEYTSANPDYPGQGHAVVCFAGENELTRTEVAGQVWVTVQSGPFVTYENFGPIHGDVQAHECNT